MVLIFGLVFTLATLYGIFTSQQSEDSRTRQDIEELKRWIKDDFAIEMATLKQQMQNKDSEIKSLKDYVDRVESRSVPNDDKSRQSKRLVLHSDEDIALKFTELTGKVQTLESTVSKLQSTSTTSGSGTTYVRWGRADCPANGTELVYKGYAGGSHYTETGGGVNYLCLSDTPIYGHFESGVQGTGGNVYGAEYQLGESNSASTISFIHKNLYEDDVPCAVCRTTRSSVLMIPGRNACTAGWTMEYNGYLTSGLHAHVAASEFVCLDDHPEALPAGHRNDNGKLFYFVEGRCGSLECPPYVDGQELTCVVCSK